MASVATRSLGAEPTDQGSAFLEWRTTLVDGRAAHYGVAGHDQDPAVVFLHGWALSHRTYKAALKRLVQRGFRVLAPALPGHGGTAALPDTEAATLGDFATWVTQLLDALGEHGPVVLIGHSFGGGVAIRLTYDRPDLVRALVLIDSIGGSAWRENGSIVETMRSRPLWDWGLHFPRDVLPLRQVRRVLPVIMRDAIANALANPRAVWHTANLARFADLTDELEVLKRRGVPVVVVWGASDQIIGRLSIDSLVAAVGATDVHTVSGSHGWLLSDPEAFGEVMTNVLSVAQRAQAAGGNEPTEAQRDRTSGS